MTILCITMRLFGKVNKNCMRIPARLLVVCIVCIVMPGFAPAGKEKIRWINLQEAEKAILTERKPILIDLYTDWCGWCIKLDKDIFSQPKFKDYAHDNLVLVELDFPRKKDQPTQERKQNMQLAQQYEVLGFPTIVVLNSSGQKVWQFDGYFPGGPDAFIEQLQKLPKG